MFSDHQRSGAQAWASKHVRAAKKYILYMVRAGNLSPSGPPPGMILPVPVCTTRRARHVRSPLAGLSGTAAAAPQVFRSVCLPVHLSICPSVCSAAEAALSSGLCSSVCPSVHLSVLSAEAAVCQSQVRAPQAFLDFSSILATFFLWKRMPWLG